MNEIKIVGKMIWVKNNNQWFVSELSLTPDNNNNDLENNESKLEKEIIQKK